MSRTWIDKNLGKDQRNQLIDWIVERSTDPTGETILMGLQELFPEFEAYPSVQSCLNWKKNCWKSELHLLTLRDDKVIAEALAKTSDGSFAKANRVLSDAVLFTQLREVRETGKLDPEALSMLMGGVARMAKSYQADEQLRMKLEQYELEQETRERKAAELKKALDPKAKKTDGEIRQLVLEAVDDVMLGKGKG